MNRALTLHDLVVAGSAVLGGIGVGLLLRVLLGWLGKGATRTSWAGDDILVGALRTMAPWGALAGGVSIAAASLPLKRPVEHTVDQIVVAVLILTVTVAAARVVAQLMGVRSQGVGSATILVNITRIAVLAIGLLILLETLGISIAPLLTALGVGGLAVALALQDTLANLFAGVHILASKTVQVGDYIRLSSGEEGYVTDINWRNTVIRTQSDNLVVIPNDQLASTIMTNYHRPEQELSIVVQAGVALSSDLDLVERVTVEVAQQVMAAVEGGVPEYDPVVRFHTFGDSRAGFSVVLRAVEFSDQFRIKHEFIKRLQLRYREEGIEIAHPVRNVVLHHQDAPAALLPRQRGASDVPAAGKTLG
ncbi:mechanosensitive ion channel family protein [Streptomyces phytophilus]|uniref:mechanosensitive ion channel family protein n=1 Tax=Streptomyces phytophilus TaxID=722715 RepID=UPI0015F05F6A|nr:mechanosensitive ion channel family protein [Streptomyces phytophilus]